MPHTHQRYPSHRREVAESRGGGIAATRGRQSHPLADSPNVLPHPLLLDHQQVEQHWTITRLMQVNCWCPGQLVAPTTSSAVLRLSSACPACIHGRWCGSPCMLQLSVGGWKWEGGNRGCCQGDCTRQHHWATRWGCSRQHGVCPGWPRKPPQKWLRVGGWYLGCRTGLLRTIALIILMINPRAYKTWDRGRWPIWLIEVARLSSA